MNPRLPIPAFRHTLQYLSHQGLFKTVARASYIALNQVVRVEAFGCMSLTAEKVNPGFLDAGDLEARFLEREEVIELSKVPGSGLRTQQETERGLDQGDLCFALLDSGKPVNLSLFSAKGPTHLADNLYVRFEPPWWYMYGGHTQPEWRGRRLHAIGLILGFRALQARGVAQLLAIYEWTNFATLASAQRMGWKHCGTLSRLGFPNHSRLRRSREARRHGLSLEERTIQ